MVSISISLADIYECRDNLAGKLIPDTASQALVTEILELVTSQNYNRVPHFRWETWQTFWNAEALPGNGAADQARIRKRTR